jgi:hypothetical protein
MGYATITAWNSRRHEFLRSSNDHIPRWTPNFRATQHAKRFSPDIAWQPPIASLPEHVSVVLRQDHIREKSFDARVADRHSTASGCRVSLDRGASDRLAVRRELLIECLALRHQLAVLRRSDRRFRPSERLFWVCVRRWWPGWKNALVLVQPATVARWHREGLRGCWSRRLRRRLGRPRIEAELRALIRRIARRTFSGALRGSTASC